MGDRASSRRCSTSGIGDWGLIALGVVIGTAIGVPSARSVKMTAMPQMVALFNGVGGGAVALISLVEFREAGGDMQLESLIPILFAAIIGSISFWGSNVAFAKLQELDLRAAADPGLTDRSTPGCWRWSPWASRSSSRPGRSPRRCSG